MSPIWYCCSLVLKSHPWTLAFYTQDIICQADEHILMLEQDGFHFSVTQPYLLCISTSQRRSISSVIQVLPLNMQMKGEKEQL